MQTRAEGHILQKGLAGRRSKTWGLISLSPSTHTAHIRTASLLDPLAAREPRHHALTSVRASGSVTSESHSSRRCSRPLVVSFKTNHWGEIRREREAQGKASEVPLTLWVPNRNFREKVNQLRQGGLWTRRTRRCGHRKAEAFHCRMDKALLPRPSCPPL